MISPYLNYIPEKKKANMKNAMAAAAVKNSTKFIGNHLRLGLFCNKVAGKRPATSLNTESGTDAFL